MTREEFIKAGRAVLRVEEEYDHIDKMYFMRGYVALRYGIPVEADKNRDRNMCVAGLVRDWPSDEAERADQMLNKIVDELGY